MPPRTCNVCGAISTTKATCPFNKDAKKPNPEKHNKNTLEEQAEIRNKKYREEMEAEKVARKLRAEANANSVREVLPSISYPVKNWEKVNIEPVDARDFYRIGFRVVLENGDVVMFTMSGEIECCEKISAVHVLGTPNPDLPETIFSDYGGLMLRFPDGNTFMLNNESDSGCYPKRCFFTVNGKPVFKFPVCI